MNGVLTGVVLALVWGTVVFRLPTLWRDAQQRALWATLFALAVTKTVATPGVNGLLQNLVSQPQVLPHLVGVAVAFFLLRFISLLTDHYTSRPRAARWQGLLALAVAGVLMTLVVVSPAGIPTKGSELLDGAIAPEVVAYWVALEGYLGAVLVLAGQLFWRVSRTAPAGLLRNGLRAIAGGTLMIATYAAFKTVLIVVHAFGVAIPVEAVEPPANAFRAIGTIVAVVGAAVPAYGKLRSVVRAYRSLLALRPLWLVMRRNFPDIILFSRRRAMVELAGVDDVRLRLYRRVIEIRDGMLALRDYLPADALDDARAFLRDRDRDRDHDHDGDGDRDTAALVEACGIALALDRHHLNARAGRGADAGGVSGAAEAGDAGEAGGTGGGEGMSGAGGGRAGGRAGGVVEVGVPVGSAEAGGRWSDIRVAGGDEVGASAEAVLESEIAWLSAVSAAFGRREPAEYVRYKRDEATCAQEMGGRLPTLEQKR